MNKYKIETEVSKEGLVGGLYQVLKELLLEEHGDEMKEDIRYHDIYTRDEDGGTFILDNDSDILQELSLEENVFALVDAINVLKLDKVLKC